METQLTKLELTGEEFQELHSLLDTTLELLDEEDERWEVLKTIMEKL